MKPGKIKCASGELLSPQTTAPLNSTDVELLNLQFTAPVINMPQYYYFQLTYSWFEWFPCNETIDGCMWQYFKKV